MTDPLHDLTDAHLQAALDAAGYRSWKPEELRGDSPATRPIIAYARLIAVSERLTAELAELRAKYEPEPVDPVMLEARVIAAKVLNDLGASDEQIAAGDIAAGARDDAIIVHAVRAAIRRGMEMQPAPFTRDEAERIAVCLLRRATNSRRDIIDALTTPHAELRAMRGDG